MTKLTSPTDTKALKDLPEGHETGTALSLPGKISEDMRKALAADLGEEATAALMAYTKAEHDHDGKKSSVANWLKTGAIGEWASRRLSPSIAAQIIADRERSLGRELLPAELAQTYFLGAMLSPAMNARFLSEKETDQGPDFDTIDASQLADFIGEDGLIAHCSALLDHLVSVRNLTVQEALLELNPVLKQYTKAIRHRYGGHDRIELPTIGGDIKVVWLENYLQMVDGVSQQITELARGTQVTGLASRAPIDLRLTTHQTPALRQLTTDTSKAAQGVVTVETNSTTRQLAELFESDAVTRVLSTEAFEMTDGRIIPMSMFSVLNPELEGRLQKLLNDFKDGTLDQAALVNELDQLIDQVITSAQANDGQLSLRDKLGRTHTLESYASSGASRAIVDAAIEQGLVKGINHYEMPKTGVGPNVPSAETHNPAIVQLISFRNCLATFFALKQKDDDASEVF